MFDEQPDGDPHGECAAEIARLTAALKQANESTERFEREWYLRGDALEWYATEARALAENMAAKHDMAVLASVNVLALDAGKRANDALTHNA
jgi:hypothetical protein